MVLPKQTSVQLPLLKVLSDSGGELPISKAIESVTTYFPEITAEDLASRLSSGDNRWRNSVQWVRQQLIFNGEIDGSVRGIWKITERGMNRLKKEWSSWKPSYRMMSQEISVAKTVEAENEPEAEGSPHELLEEALHRLNENLESEILATLSGLEPPLFESVTGDLLAKMGYGNVQVTGRSSDGGIDGHCSLDALGLVKVHFQAKRWKNQVGAKEIRDFIGGIHTKHGERGIFVTTSTFSKEAFETAEKVGSIRLVNGESLANLMMKYGLGVTKTNLESAKIDRDYFEGL